MKKDLLYNLLPAFIRYRDAFEGEPLRALMAVLQSQALTLEADLEELYDNWFIETCDPWIVPYIGDLLGIRGLVESRQTVFSQRTQVANTLAYRRRKGTLGALSRAAQDATGWYAHVVKGTDLLTLTASLRHPRPDRHGSIDLRAAAVLDPAAAPFLPLPRSADVRSPNNPVPGRPDGSGFGRPAGLGLYLWRLQAYPMSRSDARWIGRRGGLDLFTFSPFGDDRPLFNLPRTLTSLDGSVSEQDVPGPLRRQPLAQETEDRRQRRSPATDFFGQPPAFAVSLPGEEGPVDPKQTLIWDLTGSRVPPPAAWNEKQVKIAVDPVSGRLAVPASSGPRPAGPPEVSCSYGVSADIGGGPYRRPSLTEPHHPDAETWEAVVSARSEITAAYGRGRARAGTLCYDSLVKALAAWPADRPQGIVRFLDSAAYPMPATEIALPQGRTRLTLEAADGACPFLHVPEGLTLRADTHADILLSGLWIEGWIAVRGSVHLDIYHSTVRPPRDKPWAAVRMEAAGEPRLGLVSCITGPLALARGAGSVTAVESILDGGEGAAISPLDPAAGVGPPAILVRCTLFGAVAAASLDVEDTLITGPVHVEQAWKSVVRSSHLAAGSNLPRRAGEADEAPCVPTFVSTRFGQPGYAQLGPHCPREIAAGGSEGAEIGAFHKLDQPFREARLPAVLDEYVPWGFEARVRFVT